MGDDSYDLAVIGGGPAGSSAARRAAQLGLKVLLLEKRAMPRMKPCGGALSEAALRQLGFELPPALINSQIRGACVHYRRHAWSARGERRIAVLVSRENFDALLLEMARQAGAVCETATARNMTRQDERALITTERVFSASAVIIAQGAAGNLIRHVRRPDRRSASALCLTARIAVPHRDPFAQSRDLVDIHFGVVKRGYAWLFHHGQYYSVGIGGTLPLPAKRRISDFLHKPGIRSAAARRGALAFGPAGWRAARAGGRAHVAGGRCGRCRRSFLRRRVGVRDPLGTDCGRSCGAGDRPRRPERRESSAIRAAL
ncbi:MAG: NAD(P)-binding protein [Phycisphaerae bacterium]|nr:NAD(P)-binding protein [Phycisphaerae bacterium]